MNLNKNLDAARRLACSLRAANRAPLVWFTEGFDTADLKEAKALLDELSELKASASVSRVSKRHEDSA